MALLERIWDAFLTVTRLHDEVKRLSATTKAQQEKIESLTERVIRLETAIEIALGSRREGGPPRLPHG